MAVFTKQPQLSSMTHFTMACHIQLWQPSSCFSLFFFFSVLSSCFEKSLIATEAHTSVLFFSSFLKQTWVETWGEDGHKRFGRCTHAEETFSSGHTVRRSQVSQRTVKSCHGNLVTGRCRFWNSHQSEYLPGPVTETEGQMLTEWYQWIRIILSVYFDSNLHLYCMSRQKLG